MATKYGLIIAGRKRATYFKTKAERDKVVKIIKGRLTYSTFNVKK